jgi:hypothetical protein
MTTEQKAKWFDSALRFGLQDKIHLVMKSRVNGVSNWAIIDTANNKVLNSNLEWEEEPPIEKRDESFLTRSRFPFETAIELFKQFKMFAE